METTNWSENSEIKPVDLEIKEDELKDEVTDKIPENEDAVMAEIVAEQPPVHVSTDNQEESSIQPQNEDENLEAQREMALALIEESTLSEFEADEQMLDAPVVEEVLQTPEIDWEALKFREIDYFKEHQLVELASVSWKNDHIGQHYLKGCQFSPDGTCLLSSANLAGMSVFELPLDLYNKDEVDVNREITQLKPVIHVPTVGNLYDFVWYPFMNSSHAETCFWISTCQNEPIKMFDAFNGSHKCSFRGYNNVDEIEAAISVAFSADGQKIFAGYKKSIKIFDTNTPGRDYKLVNLKSSISCIATNYYQENMLVVGSWNKTISIMDIRNLKANPSDEMTHHRGGVTYLKFSRDGSLLVSGARKDNHMYCWDLRMLHEPLHTLERRVENNQRIYFDNSAGTSMILSGDSRGLLHIWNIDDLNDKGAPSELQFPLYNDCLNGVSIHPFYPIIATSSGQFHFEEEYQDEEELVVPSDNSLNMWWIGKSVNYVNNE